MKEPTYLTIAGVTKGYWLADDPAVVKWKRDSEALKKLEGIVNRSANIFIRSLPDGNMMIDDIDDASEPIEAPSLLLAIEAVKEGV